MRREPHSGPIHYIEIVCDDDQFERADYRFP
jgi:hypothetical protein